MSEIRSHRLRALPPYLFAEIDRKKKAKRDAGRDVIDLGVGDPDRPTPGFIIEALEKGARDAANHRYPFGGGSRAFRDAAARFMQRRFGVKVDPDRHVTMCIGSKDGIAHLPLAVVDPGDVVCLPSPGYPVYRAGAIFAGAEPFEMPLLHENRWLPRLSAIPADVAGRTTLLWTNYPSNPVAASCDVSFYEELLAFCTNGGGKGPRPVIAASDLAYSEVYFEQPPASLWQAKNADIERTHAIEFHSLSKTFNMTGWRIGFAVGHEAVVSALAALKENCDSGQFGAIQTAAAAALDHTDHPEVTKMRQVYRERRDAAVAGLREIGCHVDAPTAGFFVWARCPLIEHAPGGTGGMAVPARRGEARHSHAMPQGAIMDSMTFCARALEEADVVLVPGAGFGEHGRNWFRVALTVETDRINEAAKRLKRIDWTR